MNINSSNTSSSTSAIDFSTLSLKILREMLPSTEGMDTPSEVWIREHADEILCSADFEGTVIHVYRNGFYTYTKDRHTSILRVDGFRKLRYSFQDGTGSVVEEAEYIDSPYFIGLLINGENQWERNAERRNGYHHGIYLDYDDSDWCDESSVPSAEDEVMEQEDEREEHERLRQAMDKLTDRQREIVNLYYFQKMTQEEIAKRLGTSRPNITQTIKRCVDLLKQNF